MCWCVFFFLYTHTHTIPATTRASPVLRSRVSITSSFLSKQGEKGSSFTHNTCTNMCFACSLLTSTLFFIYHTRVPGLPNRDCARGCNDRAQMCPQLSATDVTGKTFFSAFVFSSRIGHIWALRQLSLCTHNPTHSLYSYFSISGHLFPRMAPQFFWSARFTK